MASLENANRYDDVDVSCGLGVLQQLQGRGCVKRFRKCHGSTGQLKMSKASFIRQLVCFLLECLGFLKITDVASLDGSDAPRCSAISA
jgi:hypothetical protein